MVLFLVQNILFNIVRTLWAYRKSTVSVLPTESTFNYTLSVLPFRRICFDQLHDFCSSSISWQLKQTMHMIFYSS